MNTDGQMMTEQSVNRGDAWKPADACLIIYQIPRDPDAMYFTGNAVHIPKLMVRFYRMFSCTVSISKSSKKVSAHTLHVYFVFKYLYQQEYVTVILTMGSAQNNSNDEQYRKIEQQRS